MSTECPAPCERRYLFRILEALAVLSRGFVVLLVFYGDAVLLNWPTASASVGNLPVSVFKCGESRLSWMTSRGGRSIPGLEGFDAYSLR
jgi:hypothetical protein